MGKKRAHVILHQNTDTESSTGQLLELLYIFALHTACYSKQRSSVKWIGIRAIDEGIHISSIFSGWKTENSFLDKNWMQQLLVAITNSF